MKTTKQKFEHLITQTLKYLNLLQISDATKFTDLVTTNQKGYLKLVFKVLKYHK